MSHILKSLPEGYELWQKHRKDTPSAKAHVGLVIELLTFVANEDRSIDMSMVIRLTIFFALRTNSLPTPYGWLRLGKVVVLVLAVLESVASPLSSSHQGPVHLNQQPRMSK